MAPSITIRAATDDDVPALRRLVNAAYRVLGDMGLNFTGVTQDETTTRERMKDHEVYVAELDGRLMGTVSLQARRPADGLPHLYVHQLAVDPSLQRQGLGSRLTALAEARAAELGLRAVRLDTAIPAEHLVRWYAKRGYVPVDERQWRGKTYRSVVMEKILRVRSDREVAIFVHRDGSLLLCRRARDGVWHVPAGMVESGESARGAAARELEEETGLRTHELMDLRWPQRYPAERKRYLYAQGVTDVTLENFAVSAPSGWEPRLDAEHTEHTWRPFREVRSLLAFEQTRSAFDRLLEVLAPSRGGVDRH